ncbi:MAG: ABC transporter substrate-binding protein [Streptosporangiales bacterium]|nr:ABC transporter substrate-binding protein [Streptosporangiales bacterium]MBO0889934.1 ABC transporter substrate-binding protein [Acidothermales bacterium]
MRKFGWFKGMVLICVMALSATACSEWGSSDNSGGSSGKKGGLQKVAIGVTSLNSLHLWLIMAQDEQLMKPSGIKLDVVTFQNTGQIIPALISGSVNFGMATPEQLFGAQEKQAGLKMVASEVTNDPYQMIVRPNITSLEGLKGKTIGVTGIGASADYFTAKLLLKGHGLEEGRDYHFVNAGPPPQRATALVKGQVDAVMSFPPDAQVMLSKGMKSIAQASSLPNLHKIIMGSLISDQRWYSKNHDLAVKFMRGYLASVKWLYDPKNKAKAVADIAKDMKASTADATITYDTFITKLKASPLDGQIDPSYLTTTAKNAKSEGLKAAPSLDSLSSRYDNSLVKAAAKSD